MGQLYSMPLIMIVMTRNLQAYTHSIRPNRRCLIMSTTTPSYSDNVAKNIVSGLTDLMNKISGNKNDMKIIRKKMKIDPMELYTGIQQDFNDGYLFSGSIDSELYDENCIFTDPTLSFQGLSTFQRNVASVRPLADRFFGNTLIILYDLLPNHKGRIITAQWRMSGSLRLPWNPRIELPGRTQYTYTSTSSSPSSSSSSSSSFSSSSSSSSSFSSSSMIYDINSDMNNEGKDGRINNYNESWGVPALECLGQVLQPYQETNEMRRLRQSVLSSLSSVHSISITQETYVNENNNNIMDTDKGRLFPSSSTTSMKRNDRSQGKSVFRTYCLDLLCIKSLLFNKKQITQATSSTIEIDDKFIKLGDIINQLLYMKQLGGIPLSLHIIDETTYIMKYITSITTTTTNDTYSDKNDNDNNDNNIDVKFYDSSNNNDIKITIKNNTNRIEYSQDFLVNGIKLIRYGQISDPLSNIHNIRHQIIWEPAFFIQLGFSSSSLIRLNKNSEVIMKNILNNIDKNKGNNMKSVNVFNIDTMIKSVTYGDKDLLLSSSANSDVNNKMLKRLNPEKNRIDVCVFQSISNR